jgi:hypothetical protein
MIQTADHRRPSIEYRSAPPPRPPDPTCPAKSAAPAPTQRPQHANSADPSNSGTDRRTTPTEHLIADDQPGTRTHCRLERDARPAHAHPSDQDQNYQHHAPTDRPNRTTRQVGRLAGYSARSQLDRLTGRCAASRRCRGARRLGIGLRALQPLGKVIRRAGCVALRRSTSHRRVTRQSRTVRHHDQHSIGRHSANRLSQTSR